MENQIPQTPIINSPQTTTMQTVGQSPKKNNFLVILLSVLLLIACLIAGFFAYQTQKLANELRIMNEELSIMPTSTSVTFVEPTAGPTLNRSEKDEIETAAKKAFVNEVGQEPTTKYGLSEESLKINNDWAFGVLTIAPIGEGAGPGAHYFLARKINNVWEAQIEYTNKFKEWLKISPDGLVDPDLKKVLI
jgi:hypothetical protein